ncbi:30940_t:CDS:2 [Racocetra persica]|uniref:30940_t:CDS:1 n=1 Tax=Racocetra persica TaxID=160502 RepID=A0ACA9LIW9_9GLOM|nr:30940_t:CDS:2 [Racocetra persica]
MRSGNRDKTHKDKAGSNKADRAEESALKSNQKRANLGDINSNKISSIAQSKLAKVSSVVQESKSTKDNEQQNQQDEECTDEDLFDDPLISVDKQLFVGFSQQDDEISYTSQISQESLHSNIVENANLTTEAFNYSITIVDQKIGSLYQLCRNIANRQKDMSRDLRKLVVFDELSNGFWNIAYKKILKELILETLYPATKNFTDDQLEIVDSTTSSLKLVEWKNCKKTHDVYNSLFENNELITSICLLAFRQFYDKSPPPMHCAYTMAICDILLNLTSSSIKCSDKSVTRREAYKMNQSISQEKLAEIALEKEEEAAMAKNKKRNLKADIADEKIIKDDNDYDNFTEFDLIIGNNLLLRN